MVRQALPRPFAEFFPVPLVRAPTGCEKGACPMRISPAARRTSHRSTPAGHKISASVCYEDAYGRAAPGRWRATLLVNVTNDAWFGNFGRALPAPADRAHAGDRGGPPHGAGRQRRRVRRYRLSSVVARRAPASCRPSCGPESSRASGSPLSADRQLAPCVSRPHVGLAGASVWRRREAEERTW